MNYRCPELMAQAARKFSTFYASIGRTTRAMTAVAATVFSPAALAIDAFVWNQVTLPASTGAACGNGSAYKFYVNPNPLSDKWLVLFEGGGACWNQSACGTSSSLAASASGVPVLNASLPNGIPDNYMTSLESLTAGGLSMFGLVSPFITRFPLLGTMTKTQSWNMVYLPYCTGDVHLGNKVAVYADQNPAAPRVEYHRGYLNAKAAEAWIAANLPRAGQLLVTGFSAGGPGAQVNYPGMRAAFHPRGMSSMLNDSGPLFPAPAEGNATSNPSLPVYTRIRNAWNLDGTDSVLADLAQEHPGYFANPSDLGAAAMDIGKVFPNDRFGTAAFQQDRFYADFSYSGFFPQLDSVSGTTRQDLLNQFWRQDLANFTAMYQDAPANVGYYIPYGRHMLGSHMLSMVTFDSTGIAEFNKWSLNEFINDLTNSNPYVWNKSTEKVDYVPVQRSWQQDQQYADSTLLVWLVGFIGSLFGFLS